MTTQEFAAYVMAYAAFAVLAVLSTVAFVEAWLTRGRIIAALRGLPVPQADLEAPHASASTQLRRDRSATEPTREAL